MKYVIFGARALTLGNSRALSIGFLAFRRVEKGGPKEPSGSMEPLGPFVPYTGSLRIHPRGPFWTHRAPFWIPFGSRLVVIVDVV